MEFFKFPMIRIPTTLSLPHPTEPTRCPQQQLSTEVEDETEDEALYFGTTSPLTSPLRGCDNLTRNKLNTGPSGNFDVCPLFAPSATPYPYP